MRYLLAIICPPAAVLSCNRFGSAALNLLLTFFLYFPGLIHALMEVNKFYADRRHRELLRALYVSQHPDEMMLPEPREAMTTAQAVLIASSMFVTLAGVAWWYLFLKHKLGL